MEWHNWLATPREGGGLSFDRRISQHLVHLELRFTGERIRLEKRNMSQDGQSLTGGRQERGVCGESKANSMG